MEDQGLPNSGSSARGASSVGAGQGSSQSYSGNFQERMAAFPVDGRTSAAFPGDGRSSAAFSVDGRAPAAFPVDGRPSAAFPVDGRSSAAFPGDGRSSVPSDRAGAAPSPLGFGSANGPLYSEMGSGEHDPRYGVSGFVPLTGHNLAYPGPTGPSSSYEVSSGNFSRGGVGRGFVYPGGATAGLTWESERRQWSEAVMPQVRGFSRTDEWGRAASQQDSHVGIQFRREEGGVGRLGGPGPSLAAGQPSFGVMFEGQRSVDTMGNVGHGLVGRSGMEEGRGGDRGSGYGLVPSRGQGEDSSGGFRSSEVGQSSAFVGAGGVTDPYRGGTVNRESSAHVGLGSLGHSGRQDPSWLGRDSVQPRAPVMSSAVSRGPAGDPALGAMMLMEVSQAEVEAARNKLHGMCA